MNEKLRKLLAALETNKIAAEAINAKADDDGLLEEEDQKEFDVLAEKMGLQVKAIVQERIMLDAASSLGDVGVAAAVNGGGDESIIVGADRAELDPMGGFVSIGDFATAVVTAKVGGGIDERFMVGAAAPATLTREGVGVDGGFLIPPQMSDEIFALIFAEESLLSLTANQPVEGNAMTYRNSGEVTPWGSTGIQAYWTEEGVAITLSKINPKSDEIKLHKLAALVPVTNEMMEDSSALSAFLTEEGSQAMLWKANDSIVNGDGVGKPLGIINSGALVTQAKETSQTADTIVAANVAKMYGRWHKMTLSQRVLINPDAINQLMIMTLGNQLIWTPPQTGFTGAPDGFLFGRPIILTDHLQTLGDLNDIIFADLGFYRTLTKVGGGIRTDVSIHLYFDSDNSVFRFIFRLGGQSKMASSITPPNSAITRSPFVTLASRA